MRKVSFDPGLTQRYDGPLRRVISADGSFNVLRRGANWRDVHPYLHLVSISWAQFFAWILLAYIVVNSLFAGIYFLLGSGALTTRTDLADDFGRFLECVFFSSQTLTTVGFGAISPASRAANAIAAFEALAGLLGFAVATGLLFGRVSRPSARIAFSENALIAPYQDGTSLQFRIVNRRTNTLVEPAVTLMLMTVDRSDGQSRREFKLLKLERDRIMLFPLTWTVVHPIDSESPLFGKTAADLEALQAEFMVLAKAWDETFSQTVHQRFSYRYSELVWGANFTPAFGVDPSGSLQVHLDKVGSYATASSPSLPSAPQS
ncbi:MAG TPA: ion channel [Bryobacteraceae bacterium]|jgi:inward rectifier potassium channel|nr:ion channel [Bryobacteraceae bacterium]